MKRSQSKYLNPTRKKITSKPEVPNNPSSQHEAWEQTNPGQRIRFGKSKNK